MSLPAYDRVLTDFADFFRNVKPEDREPPTAVGIFDAIPMPADPFRSLGEDAE